MTLGDRQRSPRAREGPGAFGVQTNTDDLPPIDPTRSHLDILRGALELLEEQPTVEVTRRGCTTGDLDCGACGFPLTGSIDPRVGTHSAPTGVARVTRPCPHLRAVAELSAWVRVEEQLEREREDAEDAPSVPPETSPLVRTLIAKLHQLVCRGEMPGMLGSTGLPVNDAALLLHLADGTIQRLAINGLP